MQSRVTTQAIDIPNATSRCVTTKDPFLLVIDDVLTHEQCATLIRKFGGHAAKVTLLNNGLTKYRRIAFLDADLAKQVYTKVCHLIPIEFGVVCANSMFRLSEYEVGQGFNMHRDRINEDADGNQNVITASIFLNGPEKGGATEFVYADKTLRLRVSPKIGRAYIFDPQQFQRGLPVQGDKKYMLRTDLMTRR